MSYSIHNFGPDDILTSRKHQTRRVQVEQGDTAFYEGREYRVLKEFNILGGVSETIRVVSPTDTIVQFFGASLTLGALRLELLVGGQDGNDFNGSIPVIPTNLTSVAPNIPAQTSFENGGTLTGGDLQDLLLLVAGSPATQAKEVTINEERKLGFSAGTFYIRLTSVGTSNATGVFRSRWEEL